MDAEASAVSGVLSLSAASGTVLCISGCAVVSFVTAFFARLDAVVTASKPIPAKIPNNKPQQIPSAIFFPFPDPFFLLCGYSCFFTGSP